MSTSPADTPRVEWRASNVEGRRANRSADNPSAFDGNRLVAWSVIVLFAACLSVALYDFAVFLSALR
jgi:hypothetical protein